MKNTELMQGYVSTYQAKQFRIYLLENDLTFASWLRSEIDKCLLEKERNVSKNNNSRKSGTRSRA